ncbi:MAG: hypothetical protein SangKO_050090 [Sandaracinaceae bacterium]
MDVDAIQAYLSSTQALQLLAFAGPLALAFAVFIVERRPQIAFFGRHLTAGSTARLHDKHLTAFDSSRTDPSDLQRYDVEVQNYDEYALRAPVRVLIEALGGDGLGFRNDLHVYVLAGAGIAVCSARLLDERRCLEIRLGRVRALKSIGLRIYTSCSRIRISVVAERTAPDGSEITEQESALHRMSAALGFYPYPASRELATGTVASTRRSKRSPSWLLFSVLMAFTAAFFIGLSLFLGTLDYWTAVGLLVVFVVGTGVYAYVRREAMPVALGYVEPHALVITEVQ